MRLFYTGASIKNGTQENPLQSLGGFLSSTVVPNNRKGSTFPDLDLLDLDKDIEHVMCFILKNETTQSIQDVKIYSELIQGQRAKYELAAVTVNGNGSVERVNDLKSSPYVGTFFDISGIAEEVTLVSTLVEGGMIGLWIRRKIDKIDKKTCKDLYEDYKNKVSLDEEFEKFKLVINFT